MANDKQIIFKIVNPITGKEFRIYSDGTWQATGFEFWKPGEPCVMVNYLNIVIAGAVCDFIKQSSKENPNG